MEHEKIEVSMHYFEYFKTHMSFMGLHVLTLPDRIKNSKKDWLVVEDLFKSLVPSAKGSRLQYMVDEELIIIFNRDDANLKAMIDYAGGTFGASTYGGHYCCEGFDVSEYRPELEGPNDSVLVQLSPDISGPVNHNNLTMFWDDELETATVHIDGSVIVTFTKPQ